MSGSGYRDRGFGSHGAHHNNNPGSIGRGDVSRGSMRGFHRGYNYRSDDDWSQPRRFTRWNEPPTSNEPLHRNDQQSWSPYNNRGQYQGGSMRYQNRYDASYKPRGIGRGVIGGGVGRGYFNRGGFNFTGAPRGHHNFFSPYYSAPFRENFYDQHEKEPEEPVPPLLGSEEERQQKITDMADELKKKLSTRNTVIEEANYWNDNNINYPTSPERTVDSFIIKPIPELLHGPPELDLTVSDLKAICRVDKNSTIDPIVSDFSSEIIELDEHTRNHEVLCENTDNPVLNNVENNESVENVNDNTEVVDVNSCQETSHTIENSTTEVITESLSINLIPASSIREVSTPPGTSQTISEADSVTCSQAITTSEVFVPEVESLQTHSDVSSSHIATKLSDISLPIQEPSKTPSSATADDKKSSSSMNPNVSDSKENAIERKTSKRKNRSKQNKNCSTLDPKLSELGCDNSVINHNNYEQGQTSNHPSGFQISEVPQPPAAFDPRRRESTLTSIVPEFTHTPAPFNTHLIPMPPPIVAPMTGFTMAHPSYSAMTSFVPPIPMTYTPVINSVDYVSQPQHVTLNMCSSTIESLDGREENMNSQLNVDEALDDLKAAMEFARESMKMEDPSDDVEEDIVFPTFPDLPPVEQVSEELTCKNKIVSKKSTKTKKKSSQEIFGPCPNPEEPQPTPEPNLITSLINNNTEDVSGDDLGRRKVVFNLNSKIKKLSKTDDWADSEQSEESTKRQRKFIPIPSSPSVDVVVVAPATMAESDLNVEKTKHNEKLNESTKKSNNTEHNNDKKDTKKELIIRTSEIERRERNNKKSSDNKRIEIVKSKSHQSNSVPRVRKSEKIGNIEKTSTDVKSSSSSRKIPAKVAADTTWKERIIGRFLRMPPAAIQNVINSTSLKKFDIPMQGLVRETKSSLSLEQRTSQDEKMKNSTYDSEVFICQLKEILATAETVEPSNISTSFIHQLSEVLQLDSPLLDLPNDSAEKSPNKVQHTTSVSHEKPSTSSKIDQPLTCESSQHVRTNAPAAITSREMSKSRKIDNTKECKDTVSNTTSTVNACSTRTKGKRGVAVGVDLSNITRAVTKDSSSTSSVHASSLKMDNSNNTHKVTTNKPTNVTQQQTTATKKLSFLEAATPPHPPPAPPSPRSPPVLTRIDTPLVERQRTELDKIFTDGIAKVREAQNIAPRSRCVARRGTPRTTNANVANTWRRNDIDNPDNYRNLTEEEYEAKIVESSHLCEHEYNEYRRLAGLPAMRGAINGRKTTTHLTHIDKKYYSISTQLQSHNKTNESESDDSYSSRDSDSSIYSTSHSSSDEETQSKKNRVKKTKKRITADDFRDEMNPESERRRRERSLKHKLHKSRLKKREKRKKDKKGKKRKPKKKHRHRSSHHSRQSTEHHVNENERPLRLLKDDEIKREPKESEEIDEMPKMHQLSTITGKKATATATVLVSKATSTASIVPTIISSSSPSVSSTIQTAMPSDSPTPSISPSHVDAKVSSHAVHVGLKTIATSPLTTLQSPNPIRTTSPASANNQHLKTKAQLKQMPDALTTSSDEIHTKIEPVSSSCLETQTIVSDSISSLTVLQQSPAISTTAKSTTSCGPKKLNIQAYYERTQQRKVQEPSKTIIAPECSSQLENLQISQLKTELITAEIDNIQSPVQLDETSETIVRTVATSTVATAQQKPKCSKNSNVSSESTDPSDDVKTSTAPVRLKLQRSRKSLTSTTESETVIEEESKFVNIKSEGGKELKLKEKVKKRPGKIAKIESVPSKVTPANRSRRKLSTTQLENVNILKTENDELPSSPPISSAESINNIVDNSLMETSTRESLEQNNFDISGEKQEFNHFNSSEIVVEQIHRDDKSTEMYSHYFCFIQGLISDKLPDTVAQETMENPATSDESISTNQLMVTPSLLSADVPLFIETLNENNLLQNTTEYNQLVLHNDAINLKKEETSQESSVQIHEETECNKEVDNFINNDVLSISVDVLSISVEPTNVSNALNDQNQIPLTSALSLPFIKNQIVDDATEDEKFMENSESPLLMNLEDPKTPCLDERLSDANPPDLSVPDDEMTTTHKELSQEILQNPDFLTESPKELDKLLTAAVTDENEFSNPTEGNITDWNHDTLNDNEDDSGKLQQNVINEESPATLKSEISYNEFPHQPIILNDQFVAEEVPRNSFLDEPIAFTSETKSPTPEADNEYRILTDTDVLNAAIYENDDQLTDVIDNVVTNSLKETSVPNSETPAVESGENIEESPSISDKRLMQTVEQISLERLPSPILQGSTKSSEKDSNDDKDDEPAGNVDNVTDNTDYSEELSQNKIPESIPAISQPNSPILTIQLSETPAAATEIYEAASSKQKECDGVMQPDQQGEILQQVLSSSNVSASQKEINQSKDEKDRSSSRKSSRSKSSTPTHDVKKSKKQHYHHDKHHLEKKKVVPPKNQEVPINTVTVVSKATTKDAVLARMQEIDFTMQRLLEEKINLYNLLKTDKWPVTQPEEVSVEVKSTEKSSDKVLEKLQPLKPVSVAVSRTNDNSSSKRSGSTDLVSSKPKRPSTPKHDNPKQSKTVKNVEDKRSRHQDEQVSKAGKKRKHRDEKSLHERRKIPRTDKLPEVKKKVVEETSKSRRRNKSVEKSMVKIPQESISTVIADDPLIKTTKAFSSGESRGKVRRAVFNDSSDESQTPEPLISEDIIRGTPKIASAEVHAIIYSDDSMTSTWDRTADNSKRSALSLLEDSVNKQTSEHKKTKSSKKSKKKSLKTSDDEDNTRVSAITQSKMISKRKEEQKKSHEKMPHKKAPKSHSIKATKEHVLETIDAVVKNINETKENSCAIKEPSCSSKITDKNQQVDVKAQKKEKNEEKSTKFNKSECRVSPVDNLNVISNDESIPEGNEWTTLDSVGFIDESTQSDIVDINNSEKNEKIDKINSNYAIQSSSLTEQQCDEEQMKFGMKKLSPKCIDSDEEGQVKVFERQKYLLADWQDSPSASDHITESLHDETESTTIIEKSFESPTSTIVVIPEIITTDKESSGIRKKSTIEDIKSRKSSNEESSKHKSKKEHAEQQSKRWKSLIELTRPKSTVRELDDTESQDDENENRPVKKRGRPPKRGKTRTRRRSSRHSDTSSKTSRSRSSSIRKGKSPSSRDVTPPETERKIRPVSGGSSRKRTNLTISETHSDQRSSRRGRKRRIEHEVEEEYDVPIQRTREEMMNCKVTLIDCRLTYLRPNLDPKVLQNIGVAKINIPRQKSRSRTPESLLDSSIIIDEDKTRSDDESMELYQVETEDIQSSESSADFNVEKREDPLAISTSASPGCLSPPHLNVENEEESAIDANEKNVELSEAQTMQYTVHKGPILDIKVFGDSFLAASEDGAIYRYSKRSNGILNIYKGHDAAVTSLFVHETIDGTENTNSRWKLFSGSLDTTLRCYDIITGALDRHVAGVGSAIQCMDEAWGVIFIGTKSGHISRYDIKSSSLREDKLDFSDKPVLALKASTEGVRKVLIVASRNQPITIRDAQSGLFLRTISGQRNHTVYSLMRDQNLVYCGTSSTSLPVFDFISGEQVTQYTAGIGIVCMRLFRQLLFAGCYDGNIYVFDTKDSRLICSIPGPGNMLLSMEIVDDEIIAGSKDRRLHAWQMPLQIRKILADRA